MKERAVFTVAAVILATQTAFMQVGPEPYPAIVLPAFRGAAGYKDGIVTLQCYDAAFIRDDGVEHVVRPWQLLAEFPDSKHQAMAEAFLPGRKSFKSAGGKLARIRDAIFPGFLAGLAVTDEKADSLKRWLRKRAADLCPGQNIARVEFRWREDRIRLGKVESSTPKEPLVVELEGQ